MSNMASIDQSPFLFVLTGKDIGDDSASLGMKVYVGGEEEAGTLPWKMLAICCCHKPGTAENGAEGDVDCGVCILEVTTRNIVADNHSIELVDLRFMPMLTNEVG